jgi:NAD(P)-dependent dehydrogenase (short-subunit alcohol dehydrogenase family)
MSAALVIGAGPGLGASIAQRFAAEGLQVAVIAKRREVSEDIATQIEVKGGRALPLHANVTNETELRAAIDQAVAAFGTPEVVVYNAALVQRDLPGELTAEQLVQTYQVNVVGAITSAVHLAPAMAANGGGSILISSGLPNPLLQYTSLSLSKAALRALADILFQRYAADGIRVATVTIYGDIVPGGMFDPAAVAERFWRLHTEPSEQWEVDAPYTGM